MFQVSFYLIHCGELFQYYLLLEDIGPVLMMVHSLVQNQLTAFAF